MSKSILSAMMLAALVTVTPAAAQQAEQVPAEQAPTEQAPAEQVKGTFVGPGTYATAEGCAKHATLKAGTERGLNTVPETLTENGFESWEGACSFKSIQETTPGKIWQAEMRCGEGAEEDVPETDTFERLDDGKIKLTVEGTETVLERCAD